MKLIKQPNRWSCLPTAFAMALDVPLEDIIAYVGHDGGELKWPALPEPFCRRCFHIQELVNYCYAKGVAVIPFETYPASAPTLNYIYKQVVSIIKQLSLPTAELNESIRKAIFRVANQQRHEIAILELKPSNEERMKTLIQGNLGVFIGETDDGKPHAVAWDGTTVYDPNGTTYGLEKFLIDTFCMLKTIQP